MEELHGDQGTWQFDGKTVRIRYHAERSQDPMLRRLGECEIGVSAVAAVDFRPREQRRRWALRLTLREGFDPYAAVGAMLSKKSQPFLLTGPVKRTLLAEYWADQVRFAAGQAAESAPAGPELAKVLLAMVAPVPLHIQTEEGTAAFDGKVVRLLWSGSLAGARKRKEQRREFPLAQLASMEWAPSDSWEYGNLRAISEGHAGERPTKPKEDLSCLRFNAGREEAEALLLAATVTAHVWARRAEAAGAAQLPPGREQGRVAELATMLEQLHQEGLLTDSELADKLAALRSRQ